MSLFDTQKTPTLPLVLDCFNFKADGNIGIEKRPLPEDGLGAHALYERGAVRFIHGLPSDVTDLCQELDRLNIDFNVLRHHDQIVTGKSYDVVPVGGTVGMTKMAAPGTMLK